MAATRPGSCPPRPGRRHHRARIVAPEHVTASYKRNGDVLPTFLADGMVARLWTAETRKDRATLHIEPFATVSAQHRTALTDETQRLLSHLAPEPSPPQVTPAE